jgi:hypothetical protein
MGGSLIYADRQPISATTSFNHLEPKGVRPLPGFVRNLTDERVAPFLHLVILWVNSRKLAQGKFGQITAF